jgi:PEP-CTERM motif
VTIQIDNFSRLHVGAACRNVALSTIALAFAGAAALVASETNANAGAREVNASSYGFAASLLPNRGLEPPQKLSLSGRDWALKCSVNCGPAFGTSITSRSELLTSNNADVATRKTTDSAGHPMGLGGTVVVERLEPDASGSLLTNWVVVSERTLDGNGSHSWSLLSSGISLDAPWLPGDLYQFEGASFSMDFAAASPAGAGATPEPSTWAMILIGFAGLGLAGYRSSRNNQRSIHFPNGIYAR